MNEATTISSEAAPGTETTAPTTPQAPAATTTAPAAAPKPATSLLSAEIPDETGTDPSAETSAESPAPSAQDGPPETYQFTAEDLQPEMLEKFSSLARELGLSNDNAQKTLDWYRENILPNISQNLEAGRQAVIDGWEATIKSDPELGGGKIGKTLATAQSFIREYPRQDEFMQMLAETGIGSHPEMIRFMHHWGKGLQEDRNLIGTRTTGSRTMSTEQFNNLRPADRAKFMKSGGSVTE